MIANVANGMAAIIAAILSVMLLFQVINNVGFVFKQTQNICAKVCTHKVYFSTVN
jgi:hypothetical protein